MYPCNQRLRSGISQSHRHRSLHLRTRRSEIRTHRPRHGLGRPHPRCRQGLRDADHAASGLSVRRMRHSVRCSAGFFRSDRFSRWMGQNVRNDVEIFPDGAGSDDCGWGAGAQAAFGPQWPTKPVKLIVPFPAGSSTDVVARIVAQSLGQRLGQGVVVEDRVGASGMLGVEYVAHAAPDGYTIGLVTTSTQALAPNLQRAFHDLQKDFAPVSMIGSAPYVMVTFPGLGTKTVAGLHRARQGATREARPTAPPVPAASPTLPPCFTPTRWASI